MPVHIFFIIGLSCILTHEMDAVYSREWRMFPLLGRLDDRTGYLVFTAAHVPLYILILAGMFSLFRPMVIMILDIFFIVHIFLHALFLRHAENRFDSLLSGILIIGAGSAGLIDILIQ